MMKPEMNVGYLKELIKDLPDDMPVFVACNGYCNYDFVNQKPLDDTDTFALVRNGKLIISDPYEFEGVEDEDYEE